MTRTSVSGLLKKCATAFTALLAGSVIAFSSPKYTKAQNAFDLGAAIFGYNAAQSDNPKEQLMFKIVSDLSSKLGDREAEYDTSVDAARQQGVEAAKMNNTKNSYEGDKQSEDYPDNSQHSYSEEKTYVSSTPDNKQLEIEIEIHEDVNSNGIFDGPDLFRPQTVHYGKGVLIDVFFSKGYASNQKAFVLILDPAGNPIKFVSGETDDDSYPSINNISLSPEKMTFQGYYTAHVFSFNGTHVAQTKVPIF